MTIIGGRRLELGVAYPIVDSNTQVNLRRNADSNIPTFTTQLGDLNGISTSIHFWDQLGALPGSNHEGEHRLAPWVDKPLGEVQVHIETLVNGLSLVHRAPLGLSVISIIPSTDIEEAQYEYLRTHKAELLLDTEMYDLDLLDSGISIPIGTEVRSGNLRNKKGERKEILLPDVQSRLAIGHIRFL